MTPREYLAFERASTEKHEYVDGEVFAMAGGTREHNLAAANAVGELRSALLDRPCEVHGSDMKIKAVDEEHYHYADAFVLCGRPVFEDDTRDVVQLRRGGRPGSPHDGRAGRPRRGRAGRWLARRRSGVLNQRA